MTEDDSGESVAGADEKSVVGHSNAPTSSDADGADDTGTMEFKPAVTATMLVMFAAVAGIIVLVGVVQWKRGVIGRETADVVSAFVGLVGFVTAFRYAIRIFILRRTRYVVTPSRLRREFELLYRKHTRDVPIHQLRGVHLSKSTIQSLLGFGDLKFLTTGPDQSLGFVSFENAPDPETYRDRVQERIDRLTNQ